MGPPFAGAGLDAGAGTADSVDTCLNWGCDPDLVMVLSRSQSIVLCNAYIIPVKTMMRNPMGIFLQGLTSSLWWSVFGPLLASPVSRKQIGCAAESFTFVGLAFFLITRIFLIGE